MNGKLYPATYRSECKSCRAVGGAAHSSQSQKLMKEMGMQSPSLGTPCQCCGKTAERLVFDHDHQTDGFRGWLCYQCNTAIGNLGDNIEGLQKAINYLSTNA